MNSLIRQFFSNEKKADVHFRDVCFLTEKSDWNWETALKNAPELPRPWFELSRVSASDRIEFVRDLWLDRLPYSPDTHPRLDQFFQRLDDIAIVLHRQTEEEPLSVEMVYSLEDNSTFFRGLVPCKENELTALRAKLSVELPYDFQSFYHIHNGFGKLSELGLLRAEDIAQQREHLVDSLLSAQSILRAGSQPIDPQSLIPFYESFGLASYQCFYADWYPGAQMGNIYLSGIDYTVSDITDRKNWTEELAFPSFLDWLVHYLEGVILLA